MRFKIEQKWALVMMLLVFAASNAFSDVDEITLAKQQLNRQLLLMKQVEPMVERMELARLRMLKHQTEAVLQSIEKNGISHTGTMNEYQHLIVAYRYSVSFLKEIETPASGKKLQELQEITEAIRKARGFDDTPYTQITSHVFTQTYNLILQLKDNRNMPEDLNDELQKMVPQIGRVIAIAKEGDRPKTFAAATEVYEDLATLYPKFDKILHSNPAFDVIMDLQGLLEFYAEFAQIEN